MIFLLGSAGYHSWGAPRQSRCVEDETHIRNADTKKSCISSHEKTMAATGGYFMSGVLRFLLSSLELALYASSHPQHVTTHVLCTVSSRHCVLSPCGHIVHLEDMHDGSYPGSSCLRTNVEQSWNGGLGLSDRHSAPHSLPETLQKATNAIWIVHSKSQNHDFSRWQNCALQNVRTQTFMCGDWNCFIDIWVRLAGGKNRVQPAFVAMTGLVGRKSYVVMIRCCCMKWLASVPGNVVKNGSVTRMLLYRVYYTKGTLCFMFYECTVWTV
jgi:hypothetical protein